MAYQDIDRWKTMSKDELHQELVKLYGDDIPQVSDITHIYVNNCYELGAETEGYASKFFVSLYPAGRLPERQEVDLFSDIYLGDVYPWGRSPYKIELRGPCE